MDAHPNDSICLDEDDQIQQQYEQSRIKLEHLSAFFHVPITEAAKGLGVCTTVLKKLCRKHGIPRWPHRKIKKLDSTLALLEKSAKKPVNARHSANVQKKMDALLHSRTLLLTEGKYIRDSKPRRCRTKTGGKGNDYEGKQKDRGDEIEDKLWSGSPVIPQLPESPPSIVPNLMVPSPIVSNPMVSNPMVSSPMMANQMVPNLLLGNPVIPPMTPNVILPNVQQSVPPNRPLGVVVPPMMNGMVGGYPTFGMIYMSNGTAIQVPIVTGSMGPTGTNVYSSPSIHAGVIQANSEMTPHSFPHNTPLIPTSLSSPPLPSSSLAPMTQLVQQPPVVSPQPLPLCHYADIPSHRQYQPKVACTERADALTFSEDMLFVSLSPPPPYDLYVPVD